MQTILTSHHELTSEISSFCFAKPDGFMYTAGQFIELTLEGHGKHWFTLSSSPLEHDLCITTRQTDSAFKKALFGLQTGAAVEISQPMGDFVLPKLAQTPLVWVAGGIGITPFISQLKWLAETGEQRPIRLMWAVRSEDDIIFQEVMDAAQQHATIVVSEPTAAWGGERGHLTAEMVKALAELDQDTQIFISGPEPFVDTLKKGLPTKQVVTDAFPGYTSI